MTSRPGPGIQESLHSRGSGPQVRRQPSKPIANPQHNPQQQLDQPIDPTLDDQRRPADDAASRPRTAKAKPPPLEAIHTSSAHDAVRPPPKGKPQVFFTNLASNPQDVSTSSPRAQSITNLPAPPRPGRPADGSQQRRIVPGGTGVKTEVAVKLPSNDAPAPSIVFPGGKTVDLFPWSSNQTEDLLTEAFVKTGITNKAIMGNETNTARPSLWSNLKNKSGIPTLSTLFVAVLEKRQSCGRLSTTNSFKPPPRLTLRDSTRETWLHDLANPNVNLRRLSRTIPHGITGKVLLDQCLNKVIPLPRAVWLAKCVGINEMRSHKRKGQAGTITWVRGWTSSVEQFLDSTIATMGQPDWKPRITYALQLTTQLYKEHLLEEDHYVDWILRNLESSSTERLFLWLLLVTIYWPDLTSSRRRGKRVAESLLTHAEKLYPIEDETPTSPVLDLLEKIITKLLATSPACLLLPTSWEKYAAVLRTLAQRHSHPQVARIIEHLDRRNARLLRSSQNTTSVTQDRTRKVLSLLDSVDYSAGLSIESLAFECMELVSDARRLLSIGLQWASSLYRDGLHRVYLVTRLIRKWAQLGADVDDSILTYLHVMHTKTGTEPRNVFKIVAELVRSKTFTVGKYLQWLIATGTANQHHDLSSSSAWPLRLITEIPLTGLSEQVRNLRSTLLRGTSSSTEAEEQSLDDAEDAVRQHIPHLFGQSMFDTLPSQPTTVGLSSTVKLEIAILLRQQVSANVEIIDRVPTKDPSVEESGPVCTISAQDFHMVRTYLETFGDLAILADVVGIVTTSLDGAVLASAADTLHFHQKAFSAIGAFTPLFGKIAMRYAAIRTIRFPERELLVSLLDLSLVARADGHLRQVLAYDLSRIDQKSAIAACSPVSDTMAEVIHNNAMDSDEEIDRILSSGTSMDQQIMARVFDKITFNLNEQITKGLPPSGNHALWFHRLRSFDENGFEGIQTEWLRSALMKSQIKLSHVAVPALVTSNCLTMLKYLEICKTCISKQKRSNRDTVSQLCIDVLDLFLPSDQLNPLCQPSEAYRYRLEQRKFSIDTTGHLLDLVHELLEAAHPSTRPDTTSVLSSDRLLAVLRYFSINDMPLFSKTLSIGVKTLPAAASHSLKTLLGHLLDPTDELGISQKSLEQQVTSVVDATDYLSLPFCQLFIQQVFSMNVASPESSVDTISAELLKAIKTAVEKDQAPWSDLVAGLESDLTTKIREHAERELLNASAFLCNSAASKQEHVTVSNEAFIKKYLTVIDHTASADPRDAHVSILAGLIERLRGVTEAFSRSNDEISGQQTRDPTLQTSLLYSWLNALLRLALVHSSTSLNKAPNQHQAALLWSLRLLFIHPVLAKNLSMMEYVFDVAVLLSDSISDEVRNHLCKLELLKGTNEARCGFVLGTTPTRDGWLALMKPVPPSAAQATPSPQPQSQPPGQLQQQQQHQSGQQYQSPSPASLQRSLSQQQQQGQNQARMFSQYPQHAQQNKMLTQFQRISNAQNSQHTPLQQMQQMQQMQALAQQRSMQPSPVQMQRQAASTPQPGSAAGKGTSAKQEKLEMRQIPFSLKRWEILPESGGNPAGNETAISMSLFGARRV